jgi:hypothetical protein
MQAGAPPAIAALGGLLGLKSGDAVLDFPIAELAAQGPIALAHWVRGIFTNVPSRTDWLAHLASLLGAAPGSDRVSFTLGSAAIVLGLKLDTGPSGNPRLTPTLGVELGNATARVQAAAELFRVDLVSGAAVALPSLGVWAAAGNAANRVLDQTAPSVARADTLRVGFGLDPQRKLVFVLAADGVQLGSHSYPMLDLTSPDAVMDAVGNTVGDIANQLLAGLGDALGVARRLLGLDAPAGVTAITLPALMADPTDAVGRLLAAARRGAGGREHRARRAARSDRGCHRSGFGAARGRQRGRPVATRADRAVAARGVCHRAAAARGPGRADERRHARWRLHRRRHAFRGAHRDARLRCAQRRPAAGGGCGAHRARTRREPTAGAPELGGGLALRADHVGLRLAWSPATKLMAELSAPHLVLETETLEVPVALPVIAADGSVTLPPAAWDGVEVLVGHLGALTGGLLGRVVDAFGWAADAGPAGGDPEVGARLRLADFAVDARAALAAWLPRLALSDRVHDAMSMLADLFATTSAGAGRFARGFVEGTGHPDDPYRFALGADLPNVALWFPPAGLDDRLFAVPHALREWRPGFDGLDAAALAAALRAEPGVAREVRELVFGRASETA